MKIDPETLRDCLALLAGHLAVNPGIGGIEFDGARFPASLLVEQALEELEALPAQVDRLDKLEAAVAVSQRQAREIVALVDRTSERCFDAVAENQKRISKLESAAHGARLTPLDLLGAIDDIRREDHADAAPEDE